MANTLTYIQKAAYSAMQEVAAEPAGAVMAVNSTFDSKSVSEGEYCDVPIAPVATMTTFSPSNVYPSPTAQTAARVRLQIVSPTLKTVPRYLTGEEIQSLTNADTDKEWARQNLMQMCRAMRNAIETALCLILKNGSSRAVGVAGTTPFATDLNELIDARQVLIDNGAPCTDLQCVINSSAYTNMKKLGIVQQASLAGSDAERRSGVIGNQEGAKIRMSAGIAAHTKGTATLFDVNLSAGYAVGDTAIITDGCDTGTMLAGDVITWAGDTNKYISPSNTGSGAAVTLVNLNKPGLRATLANTVEGTIGSSYTPNFLLERNAAALVVRPTFIPPNATIRQLPITDPVSGLTYLLLEISQYGQIVWELHAAYGAAVIQPEFVSTIMG